MSRNEPEEITWQVDLAEFEEYCRRSKVDPAQVFLVGSNEVRVRRGAKYLCGGSLTYRRAIITPSTQDIELRAVGFLNLFKDRYTQLNRIFTATQATTIAATVINESQGQGPNWDFGVTIGSLATVGTHDRVYDEVEIKQLLQNLTTVQVAPFDFEFTHDKVFNTYAAIGSQRPELIFRYPGNIKSIDSPLDATNLVNSIRVLGSGSGSDAAARAVVDDTASQNDYKVREAKLLESDVTLADTLVEHGIAYLNSWSRPFEVPQLRVDGNLFPYITDYGIGDYISVEISHSDTLKHINAMYRIERIDIGIDEDDNEDIQLFLSR